MLSTVFNRRQKTQSMHHQKRNSSIELLRIIAMMMILNHHFIVHNGFPVEKLPLDLEKIFLQLGLEGFGKVGVVIFFTISAWFLLDKKQTFRACLKRVWILEREILFYSICIACSYFFFDHENFGIKTLIRSFAPLTLGIWWYPTAYAIFLALLPFLFLGLKKLGKRNHLLLCLATLTIWGLLGFIPGAPSISGTFGFTYLFILLSFYKWHMKPLSLKQIGFLVGAGLGFFILYTAATICLAQFGTGINTNLILFITGENKLPVVMIGIGFFLLFNRFSFHSRIINKIAASTFAVYLITDYSASETLLWGKLFNLRTLYQRPLAILQILSILLAIYVVCTVLDFIRQTLFALTIDRRRGHWFDLLWDKVTSIDTRRICSKLHLEFNTSSTTDKTEKIAE